MINFFLSLFIFTENLSILQIFVTSENIIPNLYREGLQEIKRYDRKKGILEGVCEKKIFEYLEKNKIYYITKIPDLEDDFKNKMQNKINFGPYYTFQEAVNELNKIHSNFPNLTSPPISYGVSWEGRNIYAMKISDNPNENENEPAILLTGVHHAREPISCSIVLEFAKYLLTKYGTDPDVTWLVNNREIWIVPVINPDGYVYNETYPSGMWRKNRRNNGGSFGVDLNRNYGYMWGYDDVGSSPDPSSEIYRGPSPFSEPEIGAIRTLSNQVKPVITLNYHSYSNLLIYPWGYDDLYTPDNNLFKAMCVEMTSKSGYAYGTAWELLYNANGTSDDWMYGEQNEKPKILAFTPEVGENFWQPDTNIIMEQIGENLPMNMFVLKAAGHYVIIDSLHFVDQNGSAHIDPGDTLNLTIWLKNLGVNGNLTNVKLILKSTGSCAYVIDTLLNFPDIPAFPGNSVQNLSPFKIVTYNSFPDSSAIPFLLKIQGNPLFLKTESFYIENERPPYVLFEDGFETGLSNWVQGGTSTPWQRTTSTRYSGIFSLTDSPSSNYSNNQNTWIRTLNPINLNLNLDTFKLLFWVKYEIESGWDFVHVEISNDGSTWHKLISFTGLQTNWKRIELDLTPYKGNQVYIRFRLETDVYLTEDGIYIDDVKVIAYRKPYFAVCEATKIVEKGSDVLRESVYPEIKNLNSFLLKSKIDEEYEIEFYDASGKKLRKERVFLREGEKFYFKPKLKGLYFYIIETKHFRKTGKFVVN
ncbi:MAG: M14 family zinc carboxypeptidase [Candidatus Hydrothermales bacterium]